MPVLSAAREQTKHLVHGQRTGYLPRRCAAHPVTDDKDAILNGISECIFVGRTLAAAVGNRRSHIVNDRRGQERNSRCPVYTGGDALKTLNNATLWRGDGYFRPAAGAGARAVRTPEWRPASSTATRRPEGEIATFPPPSSTGLAGAFSSSLPSAASYTSTNLPLHIVKAQRRKGVHRVRDGQRLPRQPQAIRATSPAAATPACPADRASHKEPAVGGHGHQLACPPSESQVVASTSVCAMNSIVGAQADSTLPRILLPPLK